MAYNWRQMSDAQRVEVLRHRRLADQPWHAPPHGLEKGWSHISAACYEHQPIIGATPERMAAFEQALLAALTQASQGVGAWCLLPNHYHALVQTLSVHACRQALGRLHGLTSRQWNSEDERDGRHCWFRCLPKPIHSERHRWATMNYIHNNPVHHGYATHWQDWPFSSAQVYLSSVGRDTAERLWREYPILDMGQNWDDPDL